MTKIACAVLINAFGGGAQFVQASQSSDAASLMAAAQDTRLDSRLSAALVWQAGGAELDNMVPVGSYGVPVLLRGDVNRTDLEALGAVVGTEAGGVTTAEVPPQALASLLGVSGIEQIDAATQLEPYLNVSAVDISADDCWDFSLPYFSPPYFGFTGSNVVVGIVDTGLDPDHADFRDANNQTRVKYIWDQIGSGTPPAGFNYGAEWTSSQINAGQCTQMDTDGHGTFVAGIAAGNGRATGNGHPNYRYVGIAPEADVIVVKTTFFESKVIDGVNYCFTKAAAMGKDAVVLLAMGSQRGGHDGTSNLDVALSALTGPGRIIVAAVGNNAEQPIHSVVDLPSNGSTTLTFTIPSYPPQPTLIEGLYIEGWHESTASFRFKLTSPNGYTTNWVAPNTTSGIVTTPDGILRVTNAMVTNSKGAKQVSVDMFDSGNYAPPPGTWRLEIERISGSQTGIMDAWISAWTFGSNGVPPVFTSHVSNMKLVSSPATADSVIAVGAYTTKDRWTNASGGISLYSDYPPVLDITAYSSPGPRRDGVQRPDLTAPGYGVMSALSTDVLGGTTNTWKAEDGIHRITKFKTGTSAAAAHVAGGLALLLEEDADITPGQARATLIDRAREDEFTGSVPNEFWGHGKLNLIAPIDTAVPAGTPSQFATAVAYPNPTRGDISFEFSLSPENLTGEGDAVRVRVVDVQGRQVAVVGGVATSGDQKITWDGRSSDGQSASPGIYFAHLEAGNTEAVWKFVRMR